MARYIDADKIGYHFLHVVGHPVPEMLATEFEINAIPTADVAEVRHGEWGRQALVYDRFGDKRIGYICPICNEFVPHKGNYCLNCGAKMDLEESKRDL